MRNVVNAMIAEKKVLHFGSIDAIEARRRDRSQDAAGTHTSPGSRPRAERRRRRRPTRDGDAPGPVLGPWAESVALYV